MSAPAAASASGPGTVTNELIGEINRFGADAITKTAREYKAR